MFKASVEIGDCGAYGFSIERTTGHAHVSYCSSVFNLTLVVFHRLRRQARSIHL